MTRWRRFVVLLLVVLALPLQALAAAAMLHCAPMNGGRAAAAVRPGADAAPAVHVHHADAGHGHGGPAAGAPDAYATEHAHDGPDGHDGHDGPAMHAGSHGCSACAACCTLAGAPAMALGVAAPEPAPSLRAEPPAPAALFLTSGLERPPRAPG